MTKNIFNNRDCLTAKELQDYLQDKIEAKKLHDIECHLLDCPLCATAVEGFEEHSFTSQDEAIIQRLEAKINTEPVPEGNIKPLEKTTPKILTMNRIAAAILLLIIPVAGMLYWNNTSQDRMFSQNFETLTFDKTTRGATFANENPLLKNAMESYNAGHYKASVSQFENYFELNEENAEAMLYAGIAALEANYHQKAEDFLSTVRINSERYYDEATWYLAMTALKRGENAETLSLLDELLDDETGYYFQKATDLKKSLLK